MLPPSFEELEVRRRSRRARRLRYIAQRSLYEAKLAVACQDGGIAIEQTKTEPPAAAVSEVKNGRHGLTGSPKSPGSLEQTSPTIGAIPASGHRPPIDELEQAPPRPSSPSLDGPGPPAEPAPPGNSVRTGSGKSQKARSDQTRPLWSDEEVEKLRALYPTHSASAIGKQLGRGRNSVRAKAQHLGLRKAASPQEAKPAPKPKPLSAAVTADSGLVHAGNANRST